MEKFVLHQYDCYGGAVYPSLIWLLKASLHYCFHVYNGAPLVKIIGKIGVAPLKNVCHYFQTISKYARFSREISRECAQI